MTDAPDETAHSYEPNREDVLVQRKGVLIIMIIMLALMHTGCSHSEIDTDARMEKAVKLLNEKYGETFVVTEYLGDNVRYKTFSVEAYATAHPGQMFEAIVDFDGNEMRDFYVARRVSAKVTEAMEKAISDTECGHFIYAVPLDIETTLKDPDAGVKEFIENNKKKEFMVYLYIDERQAETSQIYECMEKIAETVDCASGYIQLFLTDRDMMEEVKEFVDTQRTFYGSYKDMTTENLVGSFRFEKGVMTKTVENLEEDMDRVERTYK